MLREIIDITVELIKLQIADPTVGKERAIQLLEQVQEIFEEEWNLS